MSDTHGDIDELKQTQATPDCDTQEGPAPAASEDARPGESASADAPAPADGPSSGKGSSELGKRVASGAVYFVIMTAGLLYSDITTVILVALLAGSCSYEFYRMMRKDGKNPGMTVGIIASISYPFAVFVEGETFVLSVTMVLMAIVLIWYVFSPRTRITDIALTVFGSLYCGLMFACLVFVRTEVSGLEGGILAFGVCLSVWANDTFAYFVGSAFGKHKLAPKISPHKSWEGFFAGMAGCLIAWLLIPQFVPALSYLWATVAGLVCGAIAVFGDFVESRIKRGAGVKDSGNIMPGHGGLLDRCDSLIFVSFAAFVVLTWSGVIAS